MSIWESIILLVERRPISLERALRPVTKDMLKDVAWAPSPSPRRPYLLARSPQPPGFSLHGAGWNHDPATSSCGRDHVETCGIVIVYRISTQLSQQGSGTFCLVEAPHPRPARPAQPQQARSSWCGRSKRAAKREGLLTRDSLTNNHKQARPGQISKKPQTRQ